MMTYLIIVGSSPSHYVCTTPRNVTLEAQPLVVVVCVCVCVLRTTTTTVCQCDPSVSVCDHKESASNQIPIASVKLWTDIIPIHTRLGPALRIQGNVLDWVTIASDEDVTTVLKHGSARLCSMHLELDLWVFPRNASPQLTRPTLILTFNLQWVMSRQGNSNLSQRAPCLTVGFCRVAVAVQGTV